MPKINTGFFIFIDIFFLGEAKRLYLEIAFTIVKCGDVPSNLNLSCKETLTLYSASTKLSNNNWHNETKW